MKTCYNFKESLKKGKEGEEILDEYFGERFEIIPTELTLDKLGIDRIFITPKGVKYGVEYKTDYKAKDSGNLYLETVSVRKGGHADTLGWGYTCMAQLLCYYVAPSTIYVIDVLWLKRMLPSLSGYKEVVVKNKGYEGAGILIPLEDMEALCEEVIELG